MTGPRQVDPADWERQLRGLRTAGWIVFDWLAVVEEPAPTPGTGGVAGEAGAGADDGPWFAVTVQLLRPHGTRSSVEDASGYGRLQVQTRIPPGSPAPSLTGVWPGAAWHEREAWEMYGLAFAGFRDHTERGLRRLLLDGIGDAAGDAPAYEPPLRKAVLLPARVDTSWPGSVEPGEGPIERPGEGRAGSRAASRRRHRPLGLPAASTEGQR